MKRGTFKCVVCLQVSERSDRVWEAPWWGPICRMCTEILAPGPYPIVREWGRRSEFNDVRRVGALALALEKRAKHGKAGTHELGGRGAFGAGRSIFIG